MGMGLSLRARLASIVLPALVTVGVVGGVSSVLVTTEAVADGKSALDSTYGYDRTWNASLRLVKVDLGLKVTEADRANGFLIFEYRSTDNGSKAVTASFEFIRSSGESVHVVAQIPQMPRYHEQMVLDKLGQKMREEYGDPPEPRVAPPPTPPDAGPDADEETNIISN
jgi:hypothetical protein